MGSEHDLMNALWSYGTDGGKTAPRYPVLASGYPDGITSPNQRKAYETVICLQSAHGGSTNDIMTATSRNIAFLERNDHGCDDHKGHGDPTRIEIGTGSHAQIWYASWAGDLLASRLLGSPTLQELAEREWQTEVVFCRRCITPDGQVLTPGCRDGNAQQPLWWNFCRDEVIAGLLRGWAPAPRTPKNGSYMAVIPLLKSAFAAGAKPEALLSADDSLIPARFQWECQPLQTGFYSSFKGLDGTTDPLWGAGYVNGELVLDWEPTTGPQ